jgi:sec-independent protein translocase protein TatA
MGSFSIWHILVVVVLVMLLFGRGKISELMGDVAKGIKNFRTGMADDPKPTAQIGVGSEKPADSVRTDANKV